MKRQMSKTLSVLGGAFYATALGALIPVASVFGSDGDPCNSNVPEAVRDAAGCNGNTNGLPNAIVSIIDAVILVSGLVAVAFIIVGGVNYMTSAGDASKTQKAKNTIMYSVIGLIICALAFVIVNFVIGTILGQ